MSMSLNEWMNKVGEYERDNEENIMDGWVLDFNKIIPEPALYEWMDKKEIEFLHMEVPVRRRSRYMHNGIYMDRGIVQLLPYS